MSMGVFILKGFSKRLLWTANNSIKIVSLVAVVLLSHVGKAQLPIKDAAKNAYLIVRMAANFHVQPREVDDQFSDDLLRAVVKKLDPQRIYFTKNDVASLTTQYAAKLDNEIMSSSTVFLEKLVQLYTQRLKQADSMVENMGKKTFNFSLKEVYSVAEDTAFAEGIEQLNTKLYKKIKLAVVASVAESYPRKATALQQKKYTDSIEPILRKGIVNNALRSFRSVSEKELGVEKKVALVYCDAIANCFDPHTNFFPPEEKEDFERQLGKKPLIFGFRLAETEDSSSIIDHLVPGSPAYKSGQLNKEDKIISIQWEGKPKIMVADKGVDYANSLIEGDHSGKLTLTVKKSDGTIRQVVLQKEKVDNGEDDDRVKSFLLKGAKSIGYISLPAFYIDWETNNNDVNGCANDVAKEILKLKKENIDGLIIDLRFNGGGSVKEAIDLAGIFIDAGPVALVKGREGKTISLKDGNRGTIYDGPLVVMVNGYSASASEMFAGTMQDYHRAIIAGTPTFGKATGQKIIPLDTNYIENKSAAPPKANSYIKLTDFKLYRVSGQTAQAKGVVPDIILPDMLSVKAKRESNEPCVLQVQPIEANKYYQPNAPINLTPLQAIAASEVDSAAAFVALRKALAQLTLAKQKKAKPLLLSEVLAQKNISMEEDDDEDDEEMMSEIDSSLEMAKEKSEAYYSVENHSYENKKLQANSELLEMNSEWKTVLRKDPYIKAVFRVIVAMAAK